MLTQIYAAIWHHHATQKGGVGWLHADNLMETTFSHFNELSSPHKVSDKTYWGITISSGKNISGQQECINMSGC